MIGVYVSGGGGGCGWACDLPPGPTLRDLLAICGFSAHVRRLDTPDPISRLNAALYGRYRIEREIGEGGMATVYLADDLKHERKVALKVLKPELAAPLWNLSTTMGHSTGLIREQCPVW